MKFAVYTVVSKQHKANDHMWDILYTLPTNQEINLNVLNVNSTDDLVDFSEIQEKLKDQHQFTDQMMCWYDFDEDDGSLQSIIIVDEQYKPILELKVIEDGKGQRV